MYRLAEEVFTQAGGETESPKATAIRFFDQDLAAPCLHLTCINAAIRDI